MKLDDRQVAQLNEIARAFDLKLVLLFGSQVTARAHALSDLDIAVLTRSQKTKDLSAIYLRLLPQLQALFPEQMVDLVILDHADPLLLYQATQDSQLLFGEPRDWLALKMRAYRSYQDHQRFFDMERQYVENRTAHFGAQ